MIQGCTERNIWLYAKYKINEGWKRNKKYKVQKNAKIKCNRKFKTWQLCSEKRSTKLLPQWLHDEIQYKQLLGIYDPVGDCGCQAIHYTHNHVTQYNIIIYSSLSSPHPPLSHDWPPSFFFLASLAEVIALPPNSSLYLRFLSLFTNFGQVTFVNVIISLATAISTDV